MTSNHAMTAVPPPAIGGQSANARALLSDIDAWARSAPLAALVTAFGGAAPDGDTTTVLHDLQAFAREHWDFRGGRERNQAADASFDEPTSRLILEAARALSMIGTQAPRRSSYTHVLVLGGLVRACVLRPRYAAKLVQNGLKAGTVTALTAFRPFGGDEPDLAAAGGLPGVHNEYEAMRAGLAAAFDLPLAAVQEHRDGQGTQLALHARWPATDPAAELVVAPSPDPTRRANTADTYRHWARNAGIGPQDDVLIVTTSIYVPQQHCDAVRVLVLEHGCRVETIGVDSSGAGEPWRQTFTPAKYLQEVLSAINAVAALHRQAQLLAA